MTILRILFVGPYNAFFAAAILVGILLAMREGRARGLPSLAWGVLLGATLAGGLLGSKLLFLDFRPIASGEKTILGALIVGVASLLLTARVVRMSAWRALDALSVPTLAAMAVGRVGCFLAGCCAGTETTVPWAVRSARTDAHVHPVQLYEMAADLLLITVLRVRFARRADGVRFLAASLGYAGVRLATEFVREGRVWYGALNAVQWSLLAIAAGLGALAAWRARVIATAALGAGASGASPDRTAARAVPRALAGRFAPADLRAAALLVAMLCASVFVTGTWLVPIEKLVLLAIAGAVAVASVSAMVPGWIPRLVPLLLAPRLGALVLAQDSVPATGPKRELLIGAAVRRGAYDQLIGREYGTDCDGGTSSWPTLANRETSLTETRVGVRERLSNGRHVTVEARYLSGRDLLGGVDSGPVSVIPTPELDLQAVGGSVEIENRASAMRFSIIGGSMSRTGVRSNGATGTAMFRLGDDRGWYGEANIADRALFPALGEFSYLGLGYAFGRGRPRALFGAGEGGYIQLFVPIERFEVDLALRTLGTHEDGSGGGRNWSVGVRQAITIKR